MKYDLVMTCCGSPYPEIKGRNGKPEYEIYCQTCGSLLALVTISATASRD